MKRALLLTLLLTAGCASKDGFIDNTAHNCGSGAEVMIEAGWEVHPSTLERASDRLNLVVRVSNNSDQDITVKRIFVDPLMMIESSPYALERGATDPMEVIAEGEDSTFEVPMVVRRRFEMDRTISTTYGAEVLVTVLLEPEQTYRCRFRV